jgi:hypothetical protein
MRILIGVLVAALLTGCTTNQTTYEQATPVESSRLLAYQSPIDGPSGVLLVTRDGGMLGSGCYLGVFVNGKLSARIGPGERAKFLVPVGDNLIGSGGDPKGNGLCGIGGITAREVAAAVKSGEAKRFKISGDTNSGFSLSPSSF